MIVLTERWRITFLLLPLALPPLLCRPLPVLAQQEPARGETAELADPFKIAPAFWGNYLARLRELQKQEARYLASPEWKNNFLQDIGTELSYIGNYAEAIAYFDKMERPRQDAFKPGAPSPLEGYQARNARETIAALAGRNRVIFINEAHHVPRHRAFTITLLKALYERASATSPPRRWAVRINSSWRAATRRSSPATTPASRCMAIWCARP
jgi:hypothetical protein